MHSRFRAQAPYEIYSLKKYEKDLVEIYHNVFYQLNNKESINEKVNRWIKDKIK